MFIASLLGLLSILVQVPIVGFVFGKDERYKEAIDVKFQTLIRK